MSAKTRIERDVPLAPLTTLELGGYARYFVRARDEATIAEALRWAHERGTPAVVLGGGSNIVFADDAIDALVIRIETRGTAFVRDGNAVKLRAAAGEPWDRLVAETVDRDLAGLECLSGIPGSVGATPVQNVGAYGQEIADVVTAVRVLDRKTRAVEILPAGDCGFSYRNSRFKAEPDRYVVLEVEFALRTDARPTLHYDELRRALADQPRPSLAATRAAVLELRRRKSMVIDADDPNRRSVGSFFTNPVVDAETANRVVHIALSEGFAPGPDAVPRWPVDGGRVKLAAGWLIEHAGLSRGFRRGAVGISSRHALALVHPGGGTTAELVALARDVRDRVRARFVVDLVPEPVFVGHRWPVAAAQPLEKTRT